MSVHRCPHCSNQWDSDYDDREGLLCGNCAEEADAAESKEQEKPNE